MVLSDEIIKVAADQPRPDLRRPPRRPRNPARPRQRGEDLHRRRRGRGRTTLARPSSIGACDMAGTFASINTALSALRYQQVALDIASTNVANVGTDGYVRRRVVGETLGAAGGPALWSRSNETGSGVQASRVDRMTDAAARRPGPPRARPADLPRHAGPPSLARVETGLAEPGENGVANALVGLPRHAERRRQRARQRRGPQPGARGGEHAGRRDPAPVRTTSTTRSATSRRT